MIDVEPWSPGGTLDTATPWQMGTGWSRSTDYGGSAKFNFTGQSKIINTTRVGVRPGSQVTARVNVQQGASSAGQA